MLEDIQEAYALVTKGQLGPTYEYMSPESQGAAIKKCSILQETSIGYSNQTELLNTFKRFQ